MQLTRRRYLWRLMETGETTSLAELATGAAFMGAALATSAAYAAHTIPDFDRAFQQAADNVFYIGSLVLTIEYGLRIWLAPQRNSDPSAAPWRTRGVYLHSPLGLIDLIAALPWVLIATGVASYEDVGELAMFSLCKAGRYVKGLGLLAQVIRNEARALISVLVVLMVLVLVASGLMYRFEHLAQPQVFTSVPRSVWWAIVTVATVGYGDMTPVTDAGRVFGGVIMILGVAMFAMPAGILATGFASEMHRRSFLVTWQAVARVPLFADLNATQIADITRLLKPQVVPADRVIVHHGDMADAMFFIMSGEVEVEVSPKPVRLRQGEYFGEIAMLRDIRRTATVVSVTDCMLLTLSTADFHNLLERHAAIKDRITEIATARLADLERGSGTIHH